MADEPREELFRDVSSMLREHRGPCPAVETLIAYSRGELAHAEASALSAHLRLCPSCQELAAMGEETAEEAAEEEVDDVTWKRAARGLDARAAPWESRSTAREWRGWAATAAAALIVAAVGAGLWFEREAPGAGVAVPSVTRGAGLRAIEPLGLVEAVTAFRWQAPPVDLEFLVRVESGGEPIWSGTSDGPELAAPPELRRLLQPDTPYVWRVEARDDDGRVVLESAWTPWTLSASDDASP